MDKRLTAAGYAIKPIFKSGSLPSHLIVTLNGEDLPGSRCTLATPPSPGDAAFLAAEREAFDDCAAFAWEHLTAGEPMESSYIECTTCGGSSVFASGACATCFEPTVTCLEPPAPTPAGWAPFPAELAAPAPAGKAGYCEICGDNSTARFTGSPDRFACDRHADLLDAGKPAAANGEIGCPACREAAAMGLPGHADPRDAKIAALSHERDSWRRVAETVATECADQRASAAALAAEVERLANGLENLALVAELRDPAPEPQYDRERQSVKTARALLRRLGLALAAGLLASGLWAAPAGPQAPARAPRHVTRPISSISVKVMPHTAFQGRFRKAVAAWAITTADADSCVAWVDGGVPGIEAAESAAFKGCRAAVDRAVDAAHAAAEKGGAK